jgi:hypothetical protein
MPEVKYFCETKSSAQILITGSISSSFAKREWQITFILSYVLYETL